MRLLAQNVECPAMIDASRVMVVVDWPRAHSWDVAELTTRVRPLTSQDELQCSWEGELVVEPTLPTTSGKVSGTCPVCGSAIVLDSFRAIAVGGTIGLHGPNGEEPF